MTIAGYYNEIVMRVYCDKTTEVRITRFSHESNVKPNVLHDKFDGEIRMGSPRSGAQTKTGSFQTSRCCISETVRNRAYVTITNRK